MRIYLPLLDADAAALAPHGSSADPASADATSSKSSPETVPSRVRLEVDRPVWGVTPNVQAEHPGEDPEDLEYEALQDAVYAALESSPRPVTGVRRVAVLAGDVSDGAVTDASETHGAFGLRAVRAEDVRLASVHVTELGADAVRADDTDPALLWFDVAEIPAALAYLREDASAS